jgi:hypothetical protein
VKLAMLDGYAADSDGQAEVVVPDFRSLHGDIDFRSLLRRLSPAVKIPFQTRTGQADRKSAQASSSPGVAALPAAASACLHSGGGVPARPHRHRGYWASPLI